MEIGRVIEAQGVAGQRVDRPMEQRHAEEVRETIATFSAARHWVWPLCRGQTEALGRAECLRSSMYLRALRAGAQAFSTEAEAEAPLGRANPLPPLPPLHTLHSLHTLQALFPSQRA